MEKVIYENNQELLGSYVRKFLTNLEIKGLRAERTIKSYTIYLSKFVEFAGKIQLSELDLDLAERWQVELLGRGLSQKSTGYYLIAIRSFLRWLIKRNIKPPIYPESIEIPKYKRILKHIPSVNEIKKLLSVVKITSMKGLRDRAILELFISSGLRVGELTSLKRDHLNFNERTITVVGKGEKQRLVFYSEEASEYLTKYLQRRNDNSKWLFIDYRKPQKDRPITPRAVQRMLKTYLKKAELNTSYVVHDLRHFFATYLLKKGASLFHVKELMGHQNIGTTQIYLHATNNELAEVHKKAFDFLQSN